MYLLIVDTSREKGPATDTQASAQADMAGFHFDRASCLQSGFLDFSTFLHRARTFATLQSHSPFGQSCQSFPNPMTSQEVFFSRKDQAARALQVAQILFPSSSSASPVDNSVQAIFRRLKLSEEREGEETEGYEGLEGQGQQEDDASKQELLKKAAERGLDLLETIQDWLAMEIDKVASGSSSTDCKLWSGIYENYLTKSVRISSAKHSATCSCSAHYSACRRIPAPP